MSCNAAKPKFTGISPALEEDCPECMGKCSVKDDACLNSGPRTKTCSRCEGRGSVPTAFGAEILNLVGVHLKASTQLSGRGW